MRFAGRVANCATVLLGLVTCPSLAEAHSPMEGLGTFYSHLLHPVTVLPHALVLTALSLMLGQQGRTRARTGVLAMAAAFSFGLLVAIFASPNIIREQVLVFAALAIGGAVCLDRKMPNTWVAAVAAAAGLAIGLDSGMVTTTGLRDTALAVTGVAVGVLYLTVVIAGLTVALEKQWQRVAIRIGGSWIFAVSVMVLALSFVGPTKRAVVDSVLRVLSPC